MRNKDVVFVVRFLSGFGGTENVLADVASELAKKVSVHLLVGRSENTGWLSRIDSDVHIYPTTKLRRVWRIFYYFWILKIILSRNKSLKIVTVDPASLKDVSRLRDALAPSVRVYSWFHFNFSNSYLDKNINTLHLANEYLVISQYNAKRLIESGISPSKVHVVFNPVKTDKSIRYISRNANDNQMRLAYIGRVELDGYKNLRLLLVGLSHLNFNFHLDIVGQTETSDDVLVLARQLGIANNIAIKPWVSDPWSVISHIDSLVMSSKEEGFGLVLLEALQRGLPVIAPFLEGGVQDIIQPGINGFFFSLVDEFSLGRVLLENISTIRAMKPATLRQSVQKFDMEHYIQRFYNALFI